MSQLSEQVLKVTLDYIGPASIDFLERQTFKHMKGLNFANLERKDLPELAKWVNISAGLLIDQAKAKEISDKILKL